VRDDVLAHFCSQKERRKQREGSEARHALVLCRLMRRRALSRTFALWEQRLFPRSPTEGANPEGEEMEEQRGRALQDSQLGLTPEEHKSFPVMADPCVYEHAGTAANIKTLASDIAHCLRMAQVEVDMLCEQQRRICELEQHRPESRAERDQPTRILEEDQHVLDGVFSETGTEKRPATFSSWQSRHSRRQQQQALYRWSLWQATCRRHSLLLIRHCQYSRRRATTWAFYRWYHEASRKRSHQALLVQYLLRSMRRSVARAWTFWALYFLSSRRLVVSYRRALLRVSRARRALSFESWATFVKLQVQDNSKSWKSDCVNVVVDADGSLVISENESSPRQQNSSAITGFKDAHVEAEWLLAHSSLGGSSPASWFNPTSVLKSLQAAQRLSRFERDAAVIQLSNNSTLSPSAHLPSFETRNLTSVGHEPVGTTHALDILPFGQSFSRTSLPEWSVEDVGSGALSPISPVSQVSSSSST